MWELLREIAFKILGLGGELPSPRDIIRLEDITYFEAEETLEVKNILPDIWLVTVKNTHSMDGTIDTEHTIICSNNEEYIDNLLIGDIIIWQKWVNWKGKITQKTIMHQIVKISEDEKGWYCRTKALNWFKKDPWKIRKEDIIYVGLGILW